MIVSVASIAPRGPPLTGASRTSSWGHSTASRRARAGGLVDMSTSSVPASAPSRTPPGPRTASSTAAGEGSERSTASRPTNVVGSSTPSASRRAVSRSRPTTSCPAVTRWRAIGRPIVPRPITATRTAGYGELAAEGAEARVRTPARRDRDPDHELVATGRVRDPHLERLVVRAHGVVVLVLERDVERRPCGAALLGRRKEGCALDRIAHLVPEAEVVDHGRPMLDVAVQADERALADALRRRAEKLERALGEEFAERLAEPVDQRLEVCDEASGERVLDDGARGHHPCRGLDRLAALAHDVLDKRHDLAEPVGRHRASISPPGPR